MYDIIDGMTWHVHNLHNYLSICTFLGIWFDLTDCECTELPYDKTNLKQFLVAAFTHRFAYDLQRFLIDTYISVGIDWNVHAVRSQYSISISNDCNQCQIEIECAAFIKFQISLSEQQIRFE